MADRTINACEVPPLSGPSGGVITVEFPPIGRPVNGTWTVNVILKKTAEEDGDVTIQLIQNIPGGRVIATRKATPEFTEKSFPLTVSAEELESATMGLCHVSALAVLIYGDVTVTCCPGVVIPAVLRISLSDNGDCECCATSSILKYDPIDNAWVNPQITVGTCGTVVGVRMYCDPGSGDWLMDVSECGSQSAVGLFVSSCDPFHATTGYAGAMGPCCNHPEPVSILWAITE